LLNAGGERVHDFPNPGGAVFGIRGEQFVQKGRAAPGHPYDEEGPVEALAFCGFRLAFPSLGEPKARLQEVPQMNAQEQAAQGPQVRFMLKTLQQDGQRRRQRRAAEII
jgi:hypothetical protein